MDIVVATNNKGKLAEIKKILVGYNVLAQNEVGADIDVEETGTTYAENAFLKAEAVREYTDKFIIADDSGLEVDVLNGEPGLYSARYAGDGTTPDQGMAKLISKLEGYAMEERGARFVCCIALLAPDGDKRTFTGECKGTIIDEKRGTNGFGFDPIFMVEGGNLTFAELPDTEKNKISHRYKALISLKEYLDTIS